MGGSRPSGYTLTAEGPLRLLSTLELLNMPAPTWLIESIMPSGGLVGLYGAPGSGKSFVSIDIALSVATGRPWQGLAVQQGYVIYIGAEGGTGIGKRVLAWLATHKVEPKDVGNIAWLIESIPLNADSAEMGKLLERIIDEIRVRPALIIVDTLARCFDGDENQQEDMGRFIAGIDVLRREFGCTVLVVHHTRLGVDRERGSTAFRGAADTMVAVEKDDACITLQCNKQKDAEEFQPLVLQLSQVEGTDSCVVQVSSGVTKQQANVQLLREALTGLQPCKWDDWMKKTQLDKSAFMKAFPVAKREHGILKRDGLWLIGGSNG